jgi:DNA-binding HxlR family transcriptional regulator
VYRRAGCTVLFLLARPLCVGVLRAHLDGPLPFPALSERVGGASPASLRGEMVRLRDIGALQRRALKRMPYAVENELTEAGRCILAVADVVEAWLAQAPHGPMVLGSELAKDALRALIGGWGSTMLQALAARPLSLTELDSAIPDVSYSSLGRRLSAMRAAHQVEVLPGDSGAKPYAVASWTRQAVGPLIAAGYCERKHLPEATDPPTRVEIEAAFLLAIPLVGLESDHSGSCLLAVKTADSHDIRHRIAGVHIEVEKGEVKSCVPHLGSDPGSCGIGDIDSWTEAIIGGKQDSLRLGGAKPGLAAALIAGLHTALPAP